MKKRDGFLLLSLSGIVTLFTLYACSKNAREPLTQQPLIEQMSADKDVRLYWAALAQTYDQTLAEMDKKPGSLSGDAVEKASAVLIKSGRFDFVQQLARKIQGRYHLTQSSGEMMQKVLDNIVADTRTVVKLMPIKKQDPSARDITLDEEPLTHSVLTVAPDVYPALDFDLERVVYSRPGCTDWYMVTYVGGIKLSEVYQYTTCPPPSGGGNPTPPAPPVADTTSKQLKCLASFALAKKRCWNTAMKEYTAYGASLLITAGASIEVVALGSFFSLMSYLMCVDDANAAYRICLM